MNLKKDCLTIILLAWVLDAFVDGFMREIDGIEYWYIIEILA